MFVKTDYRDRAIGLMGALGVLIAGVLVTGEILAMPPYLTPEDAVHATNNITSPDVGHCDVVC